MTRSTIYRHWETVEQLSDDAASYVVCNLEGWQRRLLAQRPGGGLGDAVVASIGEPTDDPGTALRALVTGWRSRSATDARSLVATWEAAWLEHLGGWLDDHALATGVAFRDGSSGRLAALALAAVVEGHLVVRTFRSGLGIPDWCDDDRSVLVARVDALFDDLTAPTAPRPRTAPDEVDPLDPLPRVQFSEAKQALIERLTGPAGTAPIQELLIPEASRLIDMARLSRRLGVTERRLYAVWPTTADLNQELIGRLLDRERVALEELSSQAIAIGVSDEFATFEQLLVSLLQAAVRSGVRPNRTSYFATARAFSDGEVRATANQQVDSWESALRTGFLAILAMAGWFRRPGISADDYAKTMLSALVGLHRLAALNPGLLDEAVSRRGVDLPLCGLALYQVGRSLSTAERPTGRPRGAPAAPPLTAT